MTYVTLPDPGNWKNQISAPWGESRQSKATPSGMNAPPSPGITLIGALFGYIHYCTEISEININLLPNTCSFHRKFRRYISLRMRKMCTLEKLNFKISRGSMAPDPLAYSCLRCSILFLPDFELFLPGLLFPIGNTRYNITYLTYTKGCFFSQ